MVAPLEQAVRRHRSDVAREVVPSSPPVALEQVHASQREQRVGIAGLGVQRGEVGSLGWLRVRRLGSGPEAAPPLSMRSGSSGRAWARGLYDQQLGDACAPRRDWDDEPYFCWPRRVAAEDGEHFLVAPIPFDHLPVLRHD